MSEEAPGGRGETAGGGGTEANGKVSPIEHGEGGKVERRWYRALCSSCCCWEKGEGRGVKWAG